MNVFPQSASGEGRQARIPAGIRIYAIGDIHGRADLLERMLNRIDADLKTTPAAYALEIYLGDYVDRGSESRQVLDRLIERSCTNRTIFLRGNHELYFADFIGNPAILDDWQQVGGIETLMSYGITPSRADITAQAGLATAFDRALPKSHRSFIGTLKSSFTCGDYYFVHAGVRPGIPLAKQREEDLLWIRNEFLLSEKNFGKIVVHGHTPVSEPDIRPNRINIDTGAYATGKLTCLVLEGEKMRFLL